MVSIGNSWDEILKDEFSGENYLKIREFLKDEYSHHVCYPSMYDIFNALKYTDYYAVKAVIIGPRPLSRRRAGSRAFLLGEKRSGYSAVACQYLQGAEKRSGHFARAARLS